MERYTLCIPTLFGLEGLVGDEMRRMLVPALLLTGWTRSY